MNYVQFTPLRGKTTVPKVPALVMSHGQRATLEVLSKSRTAAHREVQQACVLLLATDGVANSAIARTVSVTPTTVPTQRNRFEDAGSAKFTRVRPGRGRKPTIPRSSIDEIVDMTRDSKPEADQTSPVSSAFRAHIVVSA